jgi:hypothetical protein
MKKKISLIITSIFVINILYMYIGIFPPIYSKKIFICSHQEISETYAKKQCKSGYFNVKVCYYWRGLHIKSTPVFLKENEEFYCPFQKRVNGF